MIRFRHLSRTSVITTMIVAAIASIYVPSSRLFAQESSPLELGRRVVSDVVGVVIGPTFQSASGYFDSGCPCRFDGGVGAGIAVGLLYETNLVSPSATWRLGALNFGARLMYESRNVNTAFREYENVQIESTQSGQFFTVPILFRNLAESNFSMLTLTPYLSWNPFWQVFVQAGFQAGYVTSSRLKHTKFAVDTSVRLPNGETADIVFDETGRTDIVIEDTTFPRVNPLQLGIALTAGLDIPLGTRFRLAPMFNAVIPLTNIAESGSGYRLASWQILAALKMNLQ
jgi:hypothetical protein